MNTSLFFDGFSSTFFADYTTHQREYMKFFFVLRFFVSVAYFFGELVLDRSVQGFDGFLLFDVGCRFGL